MGKGGSGKSGQKGGGGNGGGKKGSGKHASLGARLTKVENQTARLKAWHTMSCKGFELRPYHAWKKDKLEAYAEEHCRDDADGFGGGYADYAEHDDDRGSDEEMSGNDDNAKEEMLRSSSKTMSKLLQAGVDPITNFTPNESQATQSQKVQETNVTAAQLKQAEAEINPEELGVSMWKAEVIGTIIERCRKQSVKAGEPRHELALRTDAETGRQMKVRTKTNMKWTADDESKCAELLKGLLDMLSYLQQSPGLIDFIAVYEKSQYTDITIKSNHIGAQIATILQAKGLNATEKYSFESFVKENVPKTGAQAKDHEKKVKATARKDMEKASTLLQVEAGGEMEWDLDDAGAAAAAGSSSSTAKNGGRRGKSTVAGPAGGASSSSSTAKQNKANAAGGHAKRRNAAGATAAGAAGGGPAVKKPK